MSLNNYSQLNQDLNVLKHYNYKRDGYFIEIGAYNGILYSNTYLLEKKYNWKGICIEPIPYLYDKLCINRKCHCSNKAIYNKDGDILKFCIKDCDVCSGLVDTMDEQVVINGEVHIRSAKSGYSSIIDIETITLNTLLEYYNAPSVIDYMSIDTEGSEFEILNSINFDKYKFGVIDVEHNFVEPRRTNIRYLLEKNGYKYNCENQFDDNYIYNK